MQARFCEPPASLFMETPASLILHSLLHAAAQRHDRHRTKSCIRDLLTVQMPDFGKRRQKKNSRKCAEQKIRRICPFVQARPPSQSASLHSNRIRFAGSTRNVHARRACMCRQGSEHHTDACLGERSDPASCLSQGLCSRFRQGKEGGIMSGISKAQTTSTTYSLSLTEACRAGQTDGTDVWNGGGSVHPTTSPKSCCVKIV